MVLLILIKWCVPYASHGTVFKVHSCEAHFTFLNIHIIIPFVLQAPNILTTTINMFIDPSENVTALKNTTGPLLFNLEFQVIILFLRWCFVIMHTTYLAFISKIFGSIGCDMYSMDAICQAILPKEEIYGKSMKHFTLFLI